MGKSKKQKAIEKKRAKQAAQAAEDVKKALQDVDRTLIISLAIGYTAGSGKSLTPLRRADMGYLGAQEAGAGYSH